MKTVYVLQLQGTGDDEYAYENAGVYTTREGALQSWLTLTRTMLTIRKRFLC